MIKQLAFAGSLLLAISTAALTEASATARSQQSPSPAGHSTKGQMSLSGKVRTKDGTPLAGARVELIPVGSASDAKGARLTVITASDGTFHADPPWGGDYIFGVSIGILSCHGRIQPPYWQRGGRLSFARGDQKTGVVYEVEGGGVLQGVLQNQTGKPVAKADVTLRQRIRIGEKTYRLFDVGSIQTDDRGHYGFCNVPEGNYFVDSQGTMPKLSENKTPDALAKDYVQTFYPNVLEEEEAHPVQIRAAGVNKLDLVLRDAATHHVRGRVVFPQSKALLQPFVVLSHVNAGNSTYIGYHMEIDKSGSFDLAGIPPGKYKLAAVADSGERDLRKAPNEYEIKHEWSARVQVDVKSSDVMTKDLTLEPNGKVTGQFWDTRGEKFQSGNMTLTIVTEDGRSLTHVLEDGREIPLDAAEVQPEGHFVFHELPPGKYRIGWLGQLWIKRPPPDKAAIYLAGSTIAGHDALRDGFEINAGEEISDASIVVAIGTGAIIGRVRGIDEKPRPDVPVLLVPAEEMKMQWHRYQVTCSVSMGYVYLREIPPGEYKIFAMEAPPISHYIQPWSCGALEKPRPEDLRIYEKDAALVHIKPGETSELDLHVISAR
jgi:hypothetical protein